MSVKVVKVGETRPSQLLWTYGPGSLIDLPNLSVTLMGLDYWDKGHCATIDEPRLLSAVRHALGNQVNALKKPPVIENEDEDPTSPIAKIGVPVKTFPRWLRCVRCGLLGEIESDQFDLKPDLYNPEKTRYVHKNCSKGSRSDAVPARFLYACRNGHIDDFPWHWFVHGGPSSCKGVLKFFESGASMQTENLVVKCEECGARQTLAKAFGEKAKDYLPGCRGRHPHLDYYEPGGCNEQAKTVLLGAVNSWFPIQLSALAIPQKKDSLSQLILDAWERIKNSKSKDYLEAKLDGFKDQGVFSGFEDYSLDEIWDAIEKEKNEDEEQPISQDDIKKPEWKVLTDPAPSPQLPYFSTDQSKPPSSYSKQISNVLLIKRLREVSALIGFTRVEAQEESVDPTDRPPMAKLTKGDPEWVSASDVHGEGIFIRFAETEVSKWESTAGVKVREQILIEGHKGWCAARNLESSKGFPGIRFTMLHTFSHLLIRELALECGYSASSIRERIYADPDKSDPMAGVLLYTAAADSDGTLGGLIELGKPARLGHIIKQALERASFCSSDPICSEHNPGEDRSLHAASCHACAFVSETSCERMNRYLDRALLVETFECQNAAFFK